LDLEDDDDYQSKEEDHLRMRDRSLPRQYSETSVATAVPKGLHAAFQKYRGPTGTLSGGRASRSRSRRTSKGRAVTSRSESDSLSIPLSRAPASLSRRPPDSKDYLERPTMSTLSGQHPDSSKSKSHSSRGSAQQDEGFSRDSARGRTGRKTQLDINTAVERVREIGWTTFRGRVEEEIDAGNVQLASALVFVGGDRVLGNARRCEQLVTSYAGGFLFFKVR
jgi:hypothetical protein